MTPKHLLTFYQEYEITWKQIYLTVYAYSTPTEIKGKFNNNLKYLGSQLSQAK